MASINKVTATRERTLKLVQTALLAAIEVILTLLYIPAGAINLNFGLVPIVIAAVFISPLTGALVGGVSGIVTMIQVLSGQSPFYVFLMNVNPVMACILCVVKTAAAGYICGIVYAALKKICKYKTLGTIVSSLLCPVVNTGIFALGMLTIFGKALLAEPTFAPTSGAGLIVIVFVGLIGINFFVEFILNMVVCPFICEALRRTPFFKEQ